MLGGMDVAIETVDAPGVRELLEASDAFHAALYPPEENFLLDLDELRAPSVTIAVGRSGGEAVGMIALVENDGYAEIKRMYLTEAARGTGLAASLLRTLEVVAIDRGIHTLRLETGPAQPAAIAFYKREGFTQIPLFGEYVGSASSVCFEKRVGA
jgi:putative acetyltransferase